MKHSFDLSVRTALLVTTLVALLPALVIIVVTGIEYGRHREQILLDEVHRHVEAIAGVHAESTTSIKRMLETVATLPVIRAEDYDERRKVLQDLLDRDPTLINIAYTDRDGIVEVSSGLPPGIDLSDRRHVQGAIRTGTFAPGEYVLARLDGRPGFPYAFPILDDQGVAEGVLTAVVDLGAYVELFSRLDLEQGTLLVLTDHQGIQLLSSSAGESPSSGTPLNPETWDAISVGEDFGTVIATCADGVERYHVYRRIISANGDDPYLYIIVGYPVHLATGAARAILLRNVLFMTAVLVLAVVVAIGLGNYVFAHRVHQLAHTALRVSHGQFEARTGIPGGRSEVALLAAAIDGMADRLQTWNLERQREAERLSQTVTEKDVLLREVHHRVKNNMQLILSIVNLQRRSGNDLVEFCGDLEARISAMVTVHETLYRSQEMGRIDARELLTRLAESETTVVSGSGISPRINIDVHPVALRLDKAIPLAMITGELITNSCKYAAKPDGTVEIVLRLEQRDGTVTLSVRDSGPGISPSVSSGVATGPGTGLGLVLVEALTRQLGGELFVDRFVTVRFPAADQRDSG